MLLSALLTITYVTWKKRPMLLLLSIALSLVFLSSLLVLYADNSELRIIGRLVSDSERISIIMYFLSDLIYKPWLLLFGFGIEEWMDPYWNQEPHIQFLHLIADYGIFVMFFYLLFCFRFIFSIFTSDESTKLFSWVFLVASSPHLLFHTYSLERGQVLIFFIVSAYIFNLLKDEDYERMNNVKNIN